MITGRQCRAARGLLGWTQADLGDACGLSKTAINNFESGGSSIKQSSAENIENAFKKCSIELTADEGVKLRRDNARILRGDKVLIPLWEDIVETMKDKGGEVLITNASETQATEKYGSDLQYYVDKRREAGITTRLLICEGDTHLIGDGKGYKWISEDIFNFAHMTYVYADKVALFLWKETVLVIIESPDAANAERERFELLWEKAKEIQIL